MLLGQRKTAIFDFSAILKEKPKHTQALCGRGFTHLMLNQQKVFINEILSAPAVPQETLTSTYCLQHCFVMTDTMKIKLYNKTIKHLILLKV